jgi:hypothetical protein
MLGVGGSPGGGQGAPVKLVRPLKASYRWKKSHWNPKEGEGDEGKRRFSNWLGSKKNITLRELVW